MYCSHCGGSLPGDARFCPQCGTPRGDQSGTTASIEAITPELPADIGELPALAPGTGLLVVVRGPSLGARFLLDHERISIGRHAEADLLLDDVTVSRHHAEVVRGPDGALLLRDLGSMNGTYVGGSRVDEHRLTTGDEIQIGRFKLAFFGSAGASSPVE